MSTEDIPIRLDPKQFNWIEPGTSSPESTPIWLQRAEYPKGDFRV